MGLERLEFGIRVWKFMLISVKTCYRSIRNHPFSVGFVCFIIYLYRSFPFMFSILVTASPVLVCTAILLGLLLVFGSPNMPEIEEKKEEKVSPLKTEATKDDFAVKRHVGKMKGIVENDYENVSLVDNEVSEVEENDCSVSYKRLVDERFDSMSIYRANGMVDGVQGTSNDSLLEKKREIHGDVSGSIGEHAEDQRVLADEVAYFSNVPKGGKFDFSLMSSSKHVADDKGDDNDDDNEYLNSSSDGAESSSHDAIIADVIPVLDELHPLLGSRASEPALLSFDDSNYVSERSCCSSNDEEEDDDEGKGAKTDNEDESKSAIKWTDDDQKNLIDLGTSELERDQRLEILIARRLAYKKTRSFTEKNLMDLKGVVISSHITPISTARQNPFELPYDTGSAPSISRPRNPFDLPWDSSKEKPDTKGDGFHEGFSGFSRRETLLQRESIFRRRGSFNVGPSPFGVPRQELKWKPYFVPEQLVTEGASLQRHSSESKMSSVPDMESVSSVPDEDNKPNEHDVYRENQPSQSSGDVESINVVLAENRCVHQDVPEIILGDGESQLEMSSNLSEAAATAHMEFNASEIHSRRDLATEYSSSSSSSSSETDEEISDVKEEHFASFEPIDRETEEPSFEESEFHSTSRVVDDDQHREPVYDSSPPSLEKFLSFSSVSSNTLAEISEMSLPFMLAESTGARLKGRGETTGQSTTQLEQVGSPEGFHVAYSERAFLPEDMKTKTNGMLPVLEARSAEDIDLAFKQLNEGVDVEELIVPSMIEKSQDHAENKSKLPVVEARTLEDIHKAFEQLPESNLAELPHSSGSRNEASKDMKTETNSVLPVLEARSAEDIDLAFKQLHEGVSVEEIIVPSMIEKLQDHADNKSKLPVVEARSLEDIQRAFQQVPESNQAERPYFSGLRNESSEDSKTETNVVLPVLEARSTEDIDLAFKQLHEGVDVEEVIVPSMIEKQHDHGDIKSISPVVEARSLEDIHKAFQEVAKSNPAELPQSSGVRNELSKEMKTKTDAVLPVLEARSAEDIDLAFKQLHEGVNVEDVILPSMIEKPQDNADNKSKLPVVEARSLEDLHNAFQQEPGSNGAKMSHSSSESNESSSTVEWHEMVSAKDNEVSDEKSASGSESEYEEASEF